MEDVPEGVDVGLGHLQGLKLGQLSVVAQVRHMLSQPLEGVVETVHPLPLPGIGGPPPLAPDLDRQLPLSPGPLVGLGKGLLQALLTSGACGARLGLDTCAGEGGDSRVEVVFRETNPSVQEKQAGGGAVLVGGLVGVEEVPDLLEKKKGVIQFFGLKHVAMKNRFMHLDGDREVSY